MTTVTNILKGNFLLAEKDSRNFATIEGTFLSKKYASDLFEWSLTQNLENTQDK